MESNLRPASDYTIPESSVPLYRGYGPPSSSDISFSKSLLWYDATSDEIYVCLGNGSWRLMVTTTPFVSFRYTYSWAKAKSISIWRWLNAHTR
jgi:hypothetical protein